jgi:predicted dehydrogenase
MKVLVIGAGMYVTGRHASGIGTVMASLAEAARIERIERVLIVARSQGSAESVAEAARRINGILGTALPFEYRAIADGRTLGSQLALDEYGCAVVAVPDDLHFRFAAELIESRVPVLIVKPLTPTLREARDLVALQSRTGTYAAVEFHKRFDESNLLAKRYIAEGRFGALLYGTVDFSQRIRVPTEIFREWAERTNVFQYLGVHYADLFYFLTGLMPLRVQAVGTRGALWERGIHTYDSVHAHVLWGRRGDAEHSFVTQISTNWIDPNTTSALSDQRMKVVGTRGRIECDQKDRGIEVVTEEEGIQHVNPYFADFLPDPENRPAFQGYGYKSISTFLGDVRALAGGRRTVEELDTVRPTLRQSLVSTAVIDAVNDSLTHDSRWRQIDEIR